MILTGSYLETYNVITISGRGINQYADNIFVILLLIIIFIQSPISNVHRDTKSVDYITITYNYNN